MDLNKIYFDSNGNKCNIIQMVMKEPQWAANIIQQGEIAIAELRALKDSQPADSTDACFCRYSDAWRCAKDQNLTNQVACSCECHRHR